MNPRIEVRPAAREDIRHYFLFILEESEDAALRFLDGVDSTLDKLTDWPDIGSPRTMLNAELVGVRSLAIEGFPNHLFFYRVTENRMVRVIRVRHAAMDIDAVRMDEDE